MQMHFVKFQGKGIVIARVSVPTIFSIDTLSVTYHK